MPRIEQAASRLYGTVPGAEWLIDAPTIDDATFRTAAIAGRLWVAVDPDDTPVGFALVEDHDPDLHLRELDVHPEHARRGLGRRLVEAVLERARTSDRRVTLTTFRHVAWNAPFYRRVGFRELPPDRWTRILRSVMEEERRFGFEMRQRIVMAWCSSTRGAAEPRTRAME